MKSNITAVFDIGKTNKKFFLFDENFKEVYRSYKVFEEINDEDGFPSDNLPAIQKWAKSTFKEILSSKKYEISAINFSTYGASLVHIDKGGKPLTPLYNYVKPCPAKVLKLFNSKYGDVRKKTASPELNFLSSGLQLFWLKHFQKEVFKKIKYSLHLPQYMSFLFTGIPVSDFTSVGCHTMLWNYKKKDYHDWVYKEELDLILPPIVQTDCSVNMNYRGKKMRIGMGIHDSSAALLPYLKIDEKPFILISTGTWSVSLNPFLKNSSRVKEDLCYLQLDGKPVAATKVFLGNEYKLQVAYLSKYFGAKKGAHKGFKFSEEIYKKLISSPIPKFKFESLAKRKNEPKQTNYKSFENLEIAYHQLMIELMQVQLVSACKSKGESAIKKVYIDGGFTDNDIFVKLVSHHFSNCKVRTTTTPLGSALGAAIAISDKNLGKKFLKDNYNLKKHKPLILESI